MESIGAKLKKIRIEKKISIEQVYKKTKIHPNILLAIEEDRFSQLSPVYMKSFLKLYAEFLGLDPKEVIVDYSPPHKEKEIKEQKTQEEFLKEKKSVSFPFGVVLKYIGIVILGLFVLWLSIKIGKNVLHKFTQYKKTLLLEREKILSQSKTQETKAEPPTTKQSRPLAQEVTLAMRAKEDVWLSIKVDNKNVFQGVLKKGFAESWKGKEKIEFSVGNAAAIEVEINGKAIPSLGKRNQSLKNMLVTKEGLSRK